MANEKVTVYSKDYCPYCVMAKKLLERRGISFTAIELDINKPEQMQALISRSGLRTVPQIFFNDQLIGGYDELAQLDNKDQLNSLK